MGTNFGTPWMEKEGTSNITIEFENGALGYHFGTWGARGTRLSYSFHAHCTEGMIEFNFEDQKLYLHKSLQAHTNLESGKEETQQIEVLMEANDSSKLTQYEIKHFLECIHTGTAPQTDGPGSLQGLRVIWRLYEAEKNNTIADLRGLGLDEDWTKVTIETAH